MTRIGLVNPLGDPGIGTYTHELAEAMLDLDSEIDVFTSESAWALTLPRRHRIFPVIGNALIRQRSVLREAFLAGKSARTTEISADAPAVSAAQRRLTLLPRFLNGAPREAYLAIEFAIWLRWRGYDVLWTQWPGPSLGGVSVWSAAKAVGLHVIHTAHNVFPHEISDKHREECGHVYRWSDRIVVHSEMARDALSREFPFAAKKLVVAHHGLYTTYPASPRGREKVRESLGVDSASILALCFGGIRPYKNIDAVIGALAADESRSICVVVAGRESGYPDSNRDDPLGRTRRLAQDAGVADRVRLVAGPFSNPATSDLLAAADVVLLPYVESWGSGLLLLAMSFGKPVIVTRTGGMDEYVERYPSAVVLEDPSPCNILDALYATRARLRLGTFDATRPPHLEWPHIVRDLLPRVLP